MVLGPLRFEAGFVWAVSRAPLTRSRRPRYNSTDAYIVMNMKARKHHLQSMCRKTKTKKACYQSSSIPKRVPLSPSTERLGTSITGPGAGWVRMVRLGRMVAGRVPRVFSSSSCSDRSDALEPARGVKAPPVMESNESLGIVSGIGIDEKMDESVPGPFDGDEDIWELFGKNGEDDDNPGENNKGSPEANGETEPRGIVRARLPSR
jgi:hypothetical protein